ncbi:MAG TPA: DUF2970 domain-containing protein [Burkholderiaceae bacterium]|jgi:hypothetical protein|nr:DUF2970 domain-containing protein [Burkholderiaceae bacterium]
MARRPGLLATVKAVAWAFLGIRSRKGYEHDLSRLNPLHLIATGVLMAISFVVVLIFVVRAAIRAAGA